MFVFNFIALLLCSRDKFKSYLLSIKRNLLECSTNLGKWATK